MNEGQKVCAACGVHGQECTFVEDPQPRKRRIEGEAKDTDASKRRFVASAGEYQRRCSTLLTWVEYQISSFTSRDGSGRHHTKP